MVILDQKSNDTSLALDMMRALAAQIVCVGHAINFSGTGYTYAPEVGVMAFFVLSGFLIAYTLATKTRHPDYSFRHYAAERFSRIYSAYLPAIILIGIADVTLASLGHPLPGDKTGWMIFAKNLALLEVHPSGFFSASTFGSAGQMSSVAIEFHIYFLVGGLYFVCLGRNRLTALIFAILFAAVPFRYFNAVPKSDHALFVLWLMGFAGYFAVSYAKIDRTVAIVAGIAAAVCFDRWLAVRVPGEDYQLGNYPLFAGAFLLLTVATQATRVLIQYKFVARAIRFFAGYSFSLFLIHLTLIKAFLELFGHTRWVVIFGILAANLLAAVFASFTEAHYKKIAALLVAAPIRRRAEPNAHSALGLAQQPKTTP